MNSATIRRHKLYKYFLYHSKLYKYEELAKLFKVDERTIMRDIIFMVDAGWVSKKVVNGRVGKEEYGGFYITAR